MSKQTPPRTQNNDKQKFYISPLNNFIKIVCDHGVFKYNSEDKSILQKYANSKWWKS